MRSPTKLPGAPAIQVKEYVGTIGAVASNQVKLVTISTSAPSGYTAIGMVGWYTTASSGASYCIPYQLYLNGNTITARFWNRANSAPSSDCRVYVYIAYLKTSE